MTEDNCHFCDETQRLQTHHIVPRRFDGSDAEENLVTVCPTCHDKLEALYNKRFYDTLGVEKATGKGECDHNNCFATDTQLFENGDLSIEVCESHTTCAVTPNIHSRCSRDGFYPMHTDNSIVLVCENHSRCGVSACSARANYIEDATRGLNRACEGHAESEIGFYGANTSEQHKHTS